jgi:hypothetical protein
MNNRSPLPDRRSCETFKFRFGGQNAAYHLTVGYFPEGNMGEVFLATNKIGSQAEAIARDIAILMSLLLQHGCAMETIRNALTREGDGSPSTVAGATADILAPRVTIKKETLL